MMRLAVSVEGATEREFVNRVLRPHLCQFQTEATAVDLRGNVSLDKIRGVLPALFGGFDQVTTLYDFYGFKARGQRTILELEAAILALASEQQRGRFTPYIQQYEFEALLFAAPEQTVEWLQGSPAQLSALREAVRIAGAPELVNDRPETSPSHRMRDLFSGYDKKLHGPQIVELAGLPHIRATCQRFNAWVARLEKLAPRA